MEKIKIFVFTSEEAGQEKIDEWLRSHSSIIITNFEITSNKWNICLAISYKEDELMEDKIRRELGFNGGTIYETRRSY